MKIWYTGLALTDGIIEMEGTPCEGTNVVWIKGKGHKFLNPLDATYYFSTYEKAVESAEKLRSQRINHYEAVLDSLRSLKFQGYTVDTLIKLENDLKVMANTNYSLWDMWQHMHEGTCKLMNKTPEQAKNLASYYEGRYDALMGIISLVNNRKTNGSLKSEL